MLAFINPNMLALINPSMLAHTKPSTLYTHSQARYTHETNIFTCC